MDGSLFVCSDDIGKNQLCFHRIPIKAALVILPGWQVKQLGCGH